MTPPRLTIGIPTLDRWEHLQDAIKEAMGQTLPARIIVADQGKCPETKGVCDSWSDHPWFKRIDSPATNLWENWRFVAEQAIEDGAEFFTWLQDDDYLNEYFSMRVCRAFDHYRDANVYCSNLAMSYDNHLGFLHVRNWGPCVPVDVRRNRPTCYPGNLLVIAGYLHSWCMSPAKSFRVNDQFKRMLETLPAECDCLTERLDVAACAMGNRFIVDPKPAGNWNIHDRNESQITGEKQPGQFAPAFAYLDAMMDQIPYWRNELAGWMSCLGGIGPNLLKTYYDHLRAHYHKSPYATQIYEIIEGAIKAAGIKIEPEKEETPADVNGHLVTA